MTLAARRHGAVTPVDEAREQRQRRDPAMTTVYELTPPERPTRPDGPAIIVRADRDGVIIQPHRDRVDRDATAALVGAINAAIAAEATVLIDFDGAPPGPAAWVPFSSSHAGPPRCDPVARMVSPGFVELTADPQPWLLDVVGGRLSRCRAQDRRFLPVSAWLTVRSVCISASAVSVTTTAGERIVVYRPT
jgi:hypothetical protein